MGGRGARSFCAGEVGEGGGKVTRFPNIPLRGMFLLMPSLFKLNGMLQFVTGSIFTVGCVTVSVFTALSVTVSVVTGPLVTVEVFTGMRVTVSAFTGAFETISSFSRYLRERFIFTATSVTASVFFMLRMYLRGFLPTFRSSALNVSATM